MQETCKTNHEISQQEKGSTQRSRKVQDMSEQLAMSVYWGTFRLITVQDISPQNPDVCVTTYVDISISFKHMITAALWRRTFVGKNAIASHHRDTFPAGYKPGG